MPQDNEKKRWLGRTLMIAGYFVLMGLEPLPTSPSSQRYNVAGQITVSHAFNSSQLTKEHPTTINKPKPVLRSVHVLINEEVFEVPDSPLSVPPTGETDLEVLDSGSVTTAGDDILKAADLRSALVLCPSLIDDWYSCESGYPGLSIGLDSALSAE